MSLDYVVGARLPETVQIWIFFPMFLLLSAKVNECEIPVLLHHPCMNLCNRAKLNCVTTNCMA